MRDHTHPAVWRRYSPFIEGAWSSAIKTMEVLVSCNNSGALLLLLFSSNVFAGLIQGAVRILERDIVLRSLTWKLVVVC